MNPIDLLDVKPTSLSVEVSTKCPLNCTYCDRGGQGENLSMDNYGRILKWIENSSRIKNIVYCGIGESFMNKSFYDMVESAEVDEFTIISSGILPMDFKRLSKENKLKMVIFSIDAVEENHMKKICGENYRYDVLLENIEKLNGLVRNNKKILSLLNCTINESNYMLLEDILNFAYIHNFKIIHYSLPWGQEEFIARNYSKIQEEINRVRKLAAKYGIITDDPFKSYCCIQYDSILPFVSLSGDLFPCGFALYKNYITGNIFEEDFESVWHSEPYDKFRTGILCDDCFMMRMEKIKRGEIFGRIRQ